MVTVVIEIWSRLCFYNKIITLYYVVIKIDLRLYFCTQQALLDIPLRIIFVCIILESVLLVNV